MPRRSVPTRLPLTGDLHGLHCSVGFAACSPGTHLPVVPRRSCQWGEGKSFLIVSPDLHIKGSIDPIVYSEADRA
jgi:hypothetical protein